LLHDALTTDRRPKNRYAGRANDNQLTGLLFLVANCLRSAPARSRATQPQPTMAVSLRLNRKGTKDRPYYKIVAVDSRKRRDGRYIEQIGTYDPLKEGTNFTIDLTSADKWLSVGAKPSETVNSIIRKARTAAKA
jgi:small subunit ribosomal protein S16